MAWVYEQLFNSLNTADLNGQDSWSGSTNFDVTTTSPWEGAKAVACVLESDSSVAISRSVTGVSAGVFYVSIKVNRTAGTRRGSIYVYSGATAVGRIFCFYTGGSNKIQMLTNDGATWIDLNASISNDTWYRIGIEYDNATQANKYRTNINGGAWTSWYGYFGSPTWTNIDKIEFADEGNNGSGTGTMYWDAVSPDYYPELTTGLISYWKLDEASGDATDSVSGYTALNQNSTAYATGIIGNGADLELSSSNFFKTASNPANLNITGDTSHSFWIKIETAPTLDGNPYVILSKWNSTAGQRAIQTTYKRETGLNSGNPVIFCDFRDTDSTYTRLWRSAALGTGVWHHVVVTFDVSAGSSAGNCYIDGSGGAMTDYSSTPATSIQSTTAAFCLGAYEDSGSGLNFTDGVLDEVGVWNRVLTSTEVTELYNGGAGFQYPFVPVTSDIKTFNGLAQASIKTFDGLAIASVKTINGVTNI